MAQVRPPPPRSILITGASSGIGAALARRYARPGARLALGGRDAGRLAAIAAECRGAGAQVDEECVDVTDRAAMSAWIGRVDREAPLDLAIANAGTAGRHLPHGPERTRFIFAINLEGVLNTIEPAEAAMAARGRGQLALMSSLASFYGSPSAAAYCSSKAAVRLLGEGLRLPLGQRGIVVSVICPGYIETPMTAGIRPRLPFRLSAEQAAAIIERGLARGSARIAFPFASYLAMRVLAWLPPDLASRLTARPPAKT
jgi:NAD(P)-dependent dehydrogenase (short-subunit alcohol dehydrogenase family)